jgi:hypothetical protein
MTVKKGHFDQGCLHNYLENEKYLSGVFANLLAGTSMVLFGSVPRTHSSGPLREIELSVLRQGSPADLK